MIQISRENQDFIFTVQGLHKLWAFKNKLTIPASHVLDAYQDPEALKGWKGWRVPGTNVPHLITAGTYYLHNKKIFWDVVNKDKTIVVELNDEDYRQLIIEVDDPVEAIRLLTGT